MELNKIFGEKEVTKIEWEILNERYNTFMEYYNSFEGKLKYANEEETIEIHNEIIVTLKEELSYHFDTIEDFKKKASVCPDDQDWLFELIIKMGNDITDKLQKKIKRFSFRNSVLRGDKVESESFDLERIKEVPMEYIMPSKPTYTSSSRDRYSCPMHNEKTPSCDVYKDTNRVFCHGCNYSADNIQLYMDLNKVDFREACGQLTRLV